MTWMLALGVSALPLVAQESRSLQDMLIAAIRQDDITAVRSILASGADVAKRMSGGKTAIDVAIDLGRFEIAEILVAERRRQREAQLAAMPARPMAEVVQPSAEAPPVVASTPTMPAAPRIAQDLVRPTPVTSPGPVPVVAPPTVPTIALPALPSGSVTPEQLLAVAQQLAQAAQVLAAAQMRTTSSAQPFAVLAPPQPAPIEVARAQLVEPFALRPGRKPEPPTSTEEVAAAPATAPAIVAPSDSVVVTPRRRASESPADRLRESLEDEVEPAVAAAPPRPAPARVPAVPVTQKPAPAVQPASAQALPEPAVDGEAEPEEEAPPSDVIKAIKGIGGFFGIGSETAKPESPHTAAPREVAPREAGPRELRDQLREQQRRKNVPHVPAKRASEFRAEAAPRTETRAPLSLAPRSSNPFDPDTLPQGAVLPYADPLGGDAPEVVRPEPKPASREEASLAPHHVPGSDKGARGAPAPKAAAPATIPPLKDVQKAPAPEPTAAFERRTVPRALQPAAPKEEPGILRSIATAVGIGNGDDAEGALGLDDDKTQSRKMPVVNLRPPLADMQLTLGNSVATEARQLPRGLAEPDPCIRRSGGSVIFCVVPIDWPAPVDAAFSITTYLYQGPRAIARYDGGKASHYHALFSSSQFRDVVDHFSRRFGAPTDEWKRSISPFDRPRQPNPTYVWRSRDSRTNQVTILEVRQYDDTRNVFPDMDHGAVRLYKSGAQRVFPVITGLDIMGIDWAARSDHTDGTDGRAIANTIRSRR